MIYVDSSVALATLFSEDRRPPPHFWTQDLVASRLLEYEVWTRLHARATGTDVDNARQLIRKIALIELSTTVLETRSR